MSDIHGNLHALDAVLGDARRAGAEMLVVAGDLVHQGPRPAETLDRLRALDGELGPVRLIRGNTDRYVLEDAGPAGGSDAEERRAGLEWTREQLGDERLAWLAGLPAELSVGDRLVVHGSPQADDQGIWPLTPIEDFDSPRWDSVLVCGHTHHAMHRREGRRHVVNGGSVAWPLDGDPRPGYAVVDDGDGDELRVELRRVDYDRGRTLAELEERRVPWRRVVRHYIETASFRSRMQGGGGRGEAPRDGARERPEEKEETR